MGRFYPATDAAFFPKEKIIARNKSMVDGELTLVIFDFDGVIVAIVDEIAIIITIMLQRRSALPISSSTPSTRRSRIYPWRV